jgi:uncharacterized protein YjbJ (UPF0337 family)
MDTDKIKGAAEESTGKVQDAVGGMIGDTSTQISGKARELSGKAQQLYADGTEVLRDQTVANPLAALGVAALIGFFVGVIWSSGGQDTRSSPRRYRGDGQNY